jgi:CBS domain-containing protein
MVEEQPKQSGARSEAERTQVSSIMSPSPLCVRADVTLDKVLPLLVDENIGGVPVIDARGHPLGMLSKTDLLAEQADRADSQALEREFPPVGELLARALGDAAGQHTAGELMSTPLLALQATESVFRAAELMASRHVHRLGVVDAVGRLVGVVSSSDVVRWLARRA